MQINKLDIFKYRSDHVAPVEDEVIVEEYLEIFLDKTPYSMTMRLPGNDLDLAAGYFYTEGLIESIEDIQWIGHCPEVCHENRILVDLKTKQQAEVSKTNNRHEYVSLSSCGICGKKSFEELFMNIDPVDKHFSIEARDLLSLKGLLEARMEFFHRTGGTHAASIFSKHMEFLAFAEDIGRHNALDKVIGRLLWQKKIDQGYIGIVSSRLSFEMVQKAARLGLGIFAGVSAPTTLAVKMAEKLNITLIGFLRANRMNVYTHSERVLF